MKWCKEIETGDILTVDKLWNKTSPKNMHLDDKAEILEIKHEMGCQTGTLFKVKYKSSGTVWLSSGWFLEPEMIEDKE